MTDEKDPLNRAADELEKNGVHCSRFDIVETVFNSIDTDELARVIETLAYSQGGVNFWDDEVYGKYMAEEIKKYLLGEAATEE